MMIVPFTDSLSGINLSGEMSESISQIIKDAVADRIFIITDSNTHPLSLPFIHLCHPFAPVSSITIPAGERNKNITTLLSITDTMSRQGGTRHSLIINIGGGMVSDIGGFAAAIFKRGIRYINIPTTILAAVDAAIGGKTGIDTGLNNGIILKNELGAFHQPLASLILHESFSSLPYYEILSGYGEMLKTALLFSESLYRALTGKDELLTDTSLLGRYCTQCANFKKGITQLDPEEKGLRRILNLGHTAGHAFESRLLQKGTPFPHGICIAHGLLFSLILSNICLGFPSSEITTYAHFLKSTYPSLPLGCKDMPEILSLMRHDKKNRSGCETSFVLLRRIEEPVETYVPTGNQILEALDIYRDLF